MLVETKLFKKDENGEFRAIGSKCSKCSRVYFPRKSFCADCMEDGTIEDHFLSKKGKLISYSVAHRSMLGMKTPYAFGYVMLPEDGLMVYTVFTDCEPFGDKLVLGSDMEMIFDTIYTSYSNADMKGYMFRPLG